jgi:regulator of ribonuclease activity A
MMTFSTADLWDERGNSLQSLSLVLADFGGHPRFSGRIRTALMGDMIAAIAIDHGWFGVLVNGAVRDRVALRDMPLGIRALASNPRTSAKTGAGEADVPVEFGGVVFRPGATLYADEDGVVVDG